MVDLGKIDYFYDELWSSGRSARRRAQRVGDEWARQGLRPPGAFDNPWDYAAQFDEGFFDEQGFAPTLPGKYTDQDVQYASERFVAERNQRLLEEAIGRGNQLYGEARGALNQGISNLQAYRPGGAAAMASGFYGGKANLSADQARFGLEGARLRQIDAPDMMQASRDAAIKSANERAERSGLLQLGGQLLGTVVGGALAGPLGAAAGAVGGRGMVGGAAQSVGAATGGKAGQMIGQPVAGSGMPPVQVQGGAPGGGGGGGIRMVGGGGAGGAPGPAGPGPGGAGGAPAPGGGAPGAGGGGPGGGAPQGGSGAGGGANPLYPSTSGALSSMAGLVAPQPYGPSTELVSAASMQPPEVVRAMVRDEVRGRSPIRDALRRLERIQMLDEPVPEPLAF